MPRAVGALFAQMSEIAIRDGISFSVTLSALEILEERCMLHRPNISPTSPPHLPHISPTSPPHLPHVTPQERCIDLLHGRNPVALMMSKGGGLVFHGLIERPVASEQQLMRLLATALKARTIGANYRLGLELG